MTKKHFIAIAEAVRTTDVLAGSPREVREAVRAEFAANIADALQHFNGQFDRARFLDACTEPTNG